MATLSDNAPSPQARSATRKPTAARLRKELNILQTAELHFAQYGFEGASLELIAHDAGLSRHNLLYYFASQEELYLRVLGDVLTHWLARMSDLPRGHDPARAPPIHTRANLPPSPGPPPRSRARPPRRIAGPPPLGPTLTPWVDQLHPRLRIAPWQCLPQFSQPAPTGSPQQSGHLISRDAVTGKCHPLF